MHATILGEASNEGLAEASNETEQAEPRASTSRWPWHCALLLGAGCIYAICFCSSTRDLSGHAVGSDDAFISYRYARNWVDGLGLVFNAGERVEGYSNLLYVLLMSIPTRVGWNVFVFSVTLNTLFTLAALFLLFGYLKAELGERYAVLGGLLFALSPSLWIWASSGLETSLVILLQMAIWILVERADRSEQPRQRWLLGLSISVLVLTRADGFVTGAIACVFLALKGRRAPAAWAASFLGVTLAALIAWRLSYYHWPLPNTYYAKVSSTVVLRLRGAIKELGGVGARDGLLVYLVVIGFSAVLALKQAVTGRERAFARLEFDLFFALSWLGYWLYVGGDVFEDRFLVVLIPLGISVLLRLFVAPARNAVAGGLIVALALALQLAVVVREGQYAKSMLPKYDRWITLGRFLGAHRPNALLATSAAGKIPYFSGLKTIDILGLNDAHLAHLNKRQFFVGHSKFDPDYVLAKSPDLIASWFVGDALDLDFGMTASKYREGGYAVRFLVNSRPRSAGGYDILEVAGCTADQIVALSHRGWNFSVLEKSKPGATRCPDVPLSLASTNVASL